LDVAIEGLAPSLGVPVAGVADVTAPRGPGLVVLVAVGLEAGAQAFEEPGEGVAVPLFEGVGVEGDAGAAALVGHHGDFLDDVRVQGPAGRDGALGVPHVLVVHPDGDGVEPGPEFGSELGVAAGGWVPGFGQQVGVADGGFLVVAALGGQVEVAVGGAE